MNLQRIPLSHLISSSQPRPLVTSNVDKLATSIREVGLIQPINVIKTTVVHGIAEPGFKIVAGHHRVAACRALGWTEIDAIVMDDTGHLQCEMMEIDENLCRADLTPSQRSKHIKRRAQIWDALHPVQTQLDVGKVLPFDVNDDPEMDETEVGKVCPPQYAGQLGGARPQSKSFAAETAAVTGESKRSINQHLARAEALGDDLDRTAGTCLDKGVELDALARMPAPERAELIERAVAGEQVSARQAPAFTPSSKIKELAGNLRASLRNVLECAGCLSVAELAKMVGKEQATASEDDIELLGESVDLLQSWVDALCFVNVVSLAKRT